MDKALEWLLALGAGGVIVEGLRFVTQRRNMGAAYADTISASAVRLIKPLEERIEDLEEQIQVCSAKAEAADARAEHAEQEALYWKSEVERHLHECHLSERNG